MFQNSLDIWQGVIFSEKSSYDLFSANAGSWIWRKTSQFLKNQLELIIKHIGFLVMV